jgi:hypothetical protein
MSVAYPGIFLAWVVVYARHFFGGGGGVVVKQIKIWIEGRANENLGGGSHLVRSSTQFANYD